MKNAKKIIALLLAFAMILSAFVVMAEEATEETAVVTSVEETEETAEEAEADAISEDAEVEEIAEEAATEEVAEEEATDEETATEEAVVEEKGVIEVSPVNLGDYIKDEENWGTNSGKELTFKNGKIINETDAVQYLTYKNESFNDNLVQYKMNLKFTDESGKTIWGGFQLRSDSFGTPAWLNNNGYLVVIKSDRIEVQRWGKGGQKILTVVPNELIKDGVDANISAGAVNTDEGVNIFMFVEDTCVINVFDNDENAIREGNYFDIYSTVGSEISAYDGKGIPTVPAMPVVKGKAIEGEKFTASYSIVSFGAEVADEYTINWYYSADETGKNLTKLDESAKDEFGSKYVAVGEYDDLSTDGSEYTVKAEEIGGYYMVAIKDKDGKIVLKSNPVVVNSAEYVLSSSVALLIDCELAFVNGKKIQIDAEDYNVMPGIINDRTLVPVRFVAEAFGKTVFWDADNYLIIISNTDLGLDAQRDKLTLDYIFDKIQDRF